MFAKLSGFNSSFGFKLSILALGSISTMCSGIIVSALPMIQREFIDLPYAKLLVRMIITTPHFMVLISAPFMGFLTSKVNRKYLLCGAVVVYGTSGAVCYFIHSLYVIVAMRMILGLCIAITLATTSTLIADCLKGDDRSMITGLQTTFFSIGTVIMAGLGGIVADINWHYNFLLYALPTLMVPFAWKYLYEPRNNVEYLQYKENESASAIFGVQNNAAIVSIYLIAFINTVFYYMIHLQIPFLLDSMGMNAKSISMVLMVETASCAFFASKYKKWKKNRSFITMCTLAFAVMALSYMIVGVTGSYYIILGSMVLYGIGMGTMMPNNSLWITYSIGARNRGLILGGFHSAVYSGKSLSAIILYPLIKYTSLRLSFVCASFSMIGIAISVLYGSEKINPDTKDIFDTKDTNSVLDNTD